jgi:group I intron endonuclease
MYKCDDENYFNLENLKNEDFHTPLNSHTEEEYSVLNREAGIIDPRWMYIITKYLEPKFTVYMHVNKINGKRYIGITGQNPKKRWGTNGCGYDETNQLMFHNVIKKYGWDNFEHIIIDTGLDEGDAKRMEIYLIKKYNTLDRKFGYNLRYIDGKMRSYTDKDIIERRTKSLKITLQEHPEINEERSRKRREYHAKYGTSELTRAKLRQANLGKHVSEETKQNTYLKTNKKYNIDETPDIKGNYHFRCSICGKSVVLRRALYLRRIRKANKMRKMCTECAKRQSIIDDVLKKSGCKTYEELVIKIKEDAIKKEEKLKARSMEGH